MGPSSVHSSNDGCDLVLLPLNALHIMTQPQPNVHHETAHFSLPTDSGLQLDVKNGSDMGLGSDSTVGDGFDLAPSSMAYSTENHDSDFNPYPQLKKMRTS